MTVKADDANCNVYDSRSGLCTGCNNDYVLNRDGHCVRDFYFSVGMCTNDEDYNRNTTKTAESNSK